MTRKVDGSKSGKNRNKEGETVITNKSDGNATERKK